MFIDVVGSTKVEKADGEHGGTFTITIKSNTVRFTDLRGALLAVEAILGQHGEAV